MNEYNVYQEALNLCQRGELALGRSVADAYFTRSIALLEDLVDRFPSGNHRFHQLLGICWYNLSSHTELRTRNIEQHLETARSLKPDEQLTLAHLIYFHYEQGNYRQVLDLLEQVDDRYFADAGQGWRNLKYRELSLCCRLRLSPEQVSMEEVQHFFTEAKAMAEHDRRPLEDLETCIRELTAVTMLNAHTAALLEQCAIGNGNWRQVVPRKAKRNSD